MVVVAVDVGKNTVACSVTDEKRHRLLGPVDFVMTRSGLDSTVARIQALVPPAVGVTVGIEAAGHYHQPLMKPSSWPAGWELVELNPAHVTEQRRVQGRRRVKTDAIDLEAITELVLAGRGSPVSEPSSRYLVESESIRADPSRASRWRIRFWRDDLCAQGRRFQYCFRAGMAWMTISSPLSKIRTTVSSKARLVVESEAQLATRPVIVFDRLYPERPVG
jgi:hypothetical protein